MSIVELTVREYPLIVDLVRQTMGDELASECYDTLFHTDIERYMFGVFSEDKLIACSGWCLYGTEANISWTAVDTHYRRQGWGSELIKRVLEDSKNFPKVHVETYCRNEFLSAIRMYMMLGFTIYKFTPGSKQYPTIHLCKEVE